MKLWLNIAVLFISLVPVLSTVDVPLNLYIGTGGEGYGAGSIPPGVQVPFGMMRLSPDTSYDNTAVEFHHYGGYHYGDNEIRCFSHTHMVGAGLPDYGNIGVMPVRSMDKHVITDHGYRSKFDHKNENATAGYYTVHLDDHNVLTELTAAGPYTGIHKYTFYEANKSKYVVIDPSHTVTKGACVNATISYDESTNEFTGSVLMKGALTGRNGRGINVYFVANFSDKIISVGTWNNDDVNVNSMSTTGAHCGTFAEFDKSLLSVAMTISISFVSIDQAKANRAKDLQNCWKTKSEDNFLSCVAYSQATWNDLLHQITAEAVDADEQTKFYTSLYHVFTVPTMFSESGGYYMGMDNEVHQLTDGSSHYSDLSLWDTHRTHAPLLTLLQPNVSLDIVKSLVRMYEQGGALPRWPIANVYTGCMIGNHANQIILDNLVKQTGIFEVQTAYQAMREQAMDPNVPHAGRGCLKEYITDGYCPSDVAGSSVSLTLAYAYDDWAVGQIAEYLRDRSEAQYFSNRSQNYRNVWSEQDQFMCPRKSNKFFSCPSDPYLNTWVVEGSDYTEGNAGQWRWFVPHDIPGLAKLFKSEEYFISELDKFFSRSKDDPYNILPNPYYWAGNEPDLLAVYLFNYVGRPDLTQKYSRWLVQDVYTTKPSGVPGNDDYGTMSAWYVWSALGLYPLTGTDTYFIGSPVVNKATIKLQLGDLVITAYNNSVSNVFVKEVKLNGNSVDLKHSPFLKHFDIANGGHLEYWMSGEPMLY